MSRKRYSKEGKERSGVEQYIKTAFRTAQRGKTIDPWSPIIVIPFGLLLEEHLR